MPTLNAPPLDTIGLAAMSFMMFNHPFRAPSIGALSYSVNGGG